MRLADLAEGKLFTIEEMPDLTFMRVPPLAGCLRDDSLVRIRAVAMKDRMGWRLTDNPTMEVAADTPIIRVGVVFFTMED